MQAADSCKEEAFESPNFQQSTSIVRLLQTSGHKWQDDCKNKK